MVGYLALHKLLVRRWKAGWGDPVVEFNLIVKVFVVKVRGPSSLSSSSASSSSKYLTLHFHERRVPVNLSIIVARVQKDKLNLQIKSWPVAIV